MIVGRGPVLGMVSQRRLTSMRLDDSEYSYLEKRLESKEDAVVAARVLEALYVYINERTKAKLEHIDYDTVAGSPYYTIGIKSGVDIFMYEYIRAILSASQRVHHVSFVGNRVEIAITRCAHTGEATADTYTRVSRKRRRIDTDYSTANVSDADQTVIDSLVGDVYSSLERLPMEMTFWFETIGGGGDDDEESESTATGPPLGYTLCFSNVPHVTSAFLSYLTTQYAAAIASIYMWRNPPTRVSDGPLFIINIRSADTPIATTKRVKSNIPRGIKPRQ